ncbi:hypothetical protein LMG26858_02352 [Achromobacter anxifer]|uniref:Phage tail assembly chaperone-like domain-containing protein n=1 Tax=Achromobacter anxifer TaxID=1287737 RepID=A0A6S7CU26_9BURK|nr:phage tail assembly chaperone [Achromobacter anxifer]CAB3863610.1 hypothetical protein LMG26858_02352 [Achromobacter anxifer]
MKTVYQTDALGVFIFAQDLAGDPLDGEYRLPFRAVFVAPPATGPGLVVKWESEVSPNAPEFGSEGSGSWIEVADMRAVPLFLTASGVRYEVGTQVDGAAYLGIGALPDWLTDVARPGEYHIWEAGSGWVLNTAARDAASARSARAWRDFEIARTDFLVLPDYPIAEARRAEILEYRADLRDWPARPSFPDVASEPAPPAWLSELLQ